MSKRKTDVIDNFGERLAQLRKAAGYTQVEFAAEVGTTQRMVVFEHLDPKAKRQITQLLDTFIEREKLKQRVNTQARAQRSTSTEGA